MGWMGAGSSEESSRFTHIVCNADLLGPEGGEERGRRGGGGEREGGRGRERGGEG